jgi:structural maintenance of chromosome 3 (chondroitin sulfate proteoglycan 6)
LENQQNQLHLLYLKKGRLDKFRSKSERDAYFNSELKTIRDTLKEQNLELRGLRDQLKSYETKRDQLVTKISKIEDNLETDKDKSEKLIEEIDSLKTKRDNLSNERKGLWHTDAKLDSELRSHKEKLFKFERSLFSLMDNHTRDGLNFLAQLNSESPVAGLYGPLYQLFKVDEPFRTAVEVAAGASLFHVVVDTDETATKLMDQMKRKKVGRVTFIPINRLKALQFDYSSVKEAFPLIKQIKFENKFTKVFDHVFGSTILCPNLVVATEYSKTTQFNAITADGKFNITHICIYNLNII